MKKYFSCFYAFLPLILLIIALIIRSTFKNTDIMYETSAGYKALAVIILVAVTIIISIIDRFIYTIKAMKNPVIDGDMHMIWAICIVLFGMFIYPIYWIVHIRKENFKIKEEEKSNAKILG